MTGLLFIYVNKQSYYYLLFQLTRDGVVLRAVSWHGCEKVHQPQWCQAGRWGTCRQCSPESEGRASFPPWLSAESTCRRNSDLVTTAE